MNRIVRLVPFLAVTLLCACNSAEEKSEKQEVAQDAETSRQEDETTKKARLFFQPLEVRAENPLSEAKVKLGKLLYFDTRLSVNNDISCNSCHNLSTFGVDNLPVSPGDKGQKGERNSPTVLNAAMHASQFWDGRAKTIEEQAGMPVLNPVEMGVPDEKFLEEKLSKIELYQTMFAEVFAGEQQPITYSNIEKAIGAFERTLLTPSRFDDFLQGNDEALSAEEVKGLKVFMDAGCNSCHSGPLLGGNMFQKFGMFHNYWEFTGSSKIDEGRFSATGKESDKFMFKVPSLRNVAKTYPYFHDGSVEKLEEATRIMAKVNLNKDLSQEEVNSIASFLQALTGEVPESVQQIPEELL